MENKFNDVISALIEGHDDLKQTLVTGLYHRFKAEEGTEETPYDFEVFVAKVFEKCHGGLASTTALSGDFGVDIEHTRQDGLHLGQVKCYASQNKVDFSPIAIIHSQMVKRGATAGFVVTSSDFTDNAKKYAEGLNIELVNGKDLVELWVKSLEHDVETGKSLIPQGALN